MTNFGDGYPQYGQQQPYGTQPYGTQPYGTQPYGAQPYGTPQYGAPSYGTPQYGAPQYGPTPQPFGAAQPYGQPYGAPQPPSGGTAITAGVLAVLGGAVHILWAFTSLIGLVALAALDDDLGLPGWYYGQQVISAILVVVAAVALTTGGIMLFVRKVVSRTIIAVGCAVALIIQWVTVIVTVAIGAALENIEGTTSFAATTSGIAIMMALIMSIFPIATAVLTYLKPTLLWIGAARQAPTAW